MASPPLTNGHALTKQRGAEELGHSASSPSGSLRASPMMRMFSARASTRTSSRTSARSISARAFQQRHEFSPPREPNLREVKKQQKADKKMRQLFLSAAMPLPSHRADLGEWVRGKGSSTSRARSNKDSSPDSDSMKGVHYQTEPPSYPWQYRMRVSRKERHSADGDSRGFRSRSAADNAQTRAGARLAEQRAANERAKFEKQRVEAAARQKKATSQAHNAAIAEAGRLAEAEYSNAFTPIKDVAKLTELRTSRETRRTELLAALAASIQERDGTLKSKLGEALLTCGRTVPQLVGEWDKNNDNSISKNEFKQAIRASLRIDASNPQIETLFSTFDHDGGLTQEQLRQAVRKIFEHHKLVKEKERRLRLESEACAEQVEELNKCIQAAQDWETLNAGLAEFRLIPLLSDRLGGTLDGKTDGFATDKCEDFVKQWSMDEPGLIGRENFAKQIVLMKNKGDFRIDGTKGDVDQQVEGMFDHLVAELVATGAAGGRTSTGDDEGNGKVIDLEAMLKLLKTKTTTHKAQEAGMSEEVANAEAKARALQVAYMRETAKKEKEFELSRNASNETIAAENLRKRLEEDEEEARLTSNTAAVTKPNDPLANLRYLEGGTLPVARRGRPTNAPLPEEA